MNLKNRVVAITGAGSGLGSAAACRLAEEGCSLALIDINADSLALAKRSCFEAGAPEVAVYPANVVNEEDVITTFSSIGDRFGALHGLVNNAGVTRDGFTLKVVDGRVVSKMSLQQWQTVVDVNLTGVFLCGREAAATMVDTDSEGCIINISSITRAGNMGQINYSATKAGVHAMSVVWAKEFARHGIRAVTIAPGYVATEMVMSMKQTVLEKLTKPIPVGRIGRPEEIAATVVFLLENDYVNGRCFEIDGGLRM